MTKETESATDKKLTLQGAFTEDVQSNSMLEEFTKEQTYAAIVKKGDPDIGTYQNCRGNRLKYKNR